MAEACIRQHAKTRKLKFGLWLCLWLDVLLKLLVGLHDSLTECTVVTFGLLWGQAVRREASAILVLRLKWSKVMLSHLYL